jgi:hypothetical protein
MGHVISSVCVVVVGVLRVASLSGDVNLAVPRRWLVKEGIGDGAFTGHVVSKLEAD